ncbi:MAG TPA: ankyrin repeat domain-containing protein, partial [Vicinamibacterales bacterium]|nr:ankyrin repeat domain-containing protein [Vicinamibacterales bacterium]
MKRVLAAAAAIACASAAQPPDRVDFRRDVQPIFRQHCYSCHGPVAHESNFRLDRRTDAMRGGTIAVIGPGNSGASRLFLRIAGAPGVGPQMPPTGPLSAEQIEIIRRWIDEGAVWPDEASGETAPRPLPPLMTAVLHGDRDAVRRLIAAGADVNAKNESGASALMWAVGDLETAQLLVDRGADVNASSDDGRTPLMIAAGRHGADAVVKLLLAHGANPSATAPGQGDRTSPLLEASLAGEAGTVRQLIDAGADVKPIGFVALAFALAADCRACADLLMPALDAKAISLAGLVLIPPVFDGTKISELMARGAAGKFDVNVTDGDGRTLIMRLAASDAAPASLFQTLIAAGADVRTQGKHGETALAFARQRGRTPVVDVLVKATGAAAGAAPAAATIARPSPAPSARAAVERSLPLLQQADVTFLKKSGCVSCHHNTLTAMAVALSRGAGVRVDEDIAQDQAEAIGRYLETWRERALVGYSVAGEQDTLSAILLGLAAEDYAATDATDAMARVLLATQMSDGHWPITAHRPPIESNDVEVTAASMRALQVYAPRYAKASGDAAVKRAAAWLRRAQPAVTEERAFQLLGLGWSHAGSAPIQSAARALVASQRPDGGWAQLPSLPSDPYATGEALVALNESGAVTV